MSETPGDQPPPYPPPSSEPYGQPPGQQPPAGTWPQPPPGGWQPPPPPPTQPYPQPGYAQPGYPTYAVPEDGGANTAMVLGIVGLALGFTLCFGFGFVISPIALFTGLASRRRIDASGGLLGGRSNAQAGFVMGVIGTILLALFVLALIAFVVIVTIAISHDSSSFNNGTNA